MLRPAQYGPDRSDYRVQHGVPRSRHGALPTGLKGAHAPARLLQPNDVVIPPIGRTGLHPLPAFKSLQTVVTGREALSGRR